MREPFRKSKNSHNNYDLEDYFFQNLSDLSQNYSDQKEKLFYQINENLNQDCESTIMQRETNFFTDEFPSQILIDKSKISNDFNDEINELNEETIYNNKNIDEISFYSNINYNKNDFNSSLNDKLKNSPYNKKKQYIPDCFKNNKFYLSLNSQEQYGTCNNEEECLSYLTIHSKDEKKDNKNGYKKMGVEYNEEDINKNFIRDEGQKIINDPINNLFKINDKNNKKDIMEIPFPNQTLGRPGAGKYYIGDKRHDRYEVGNMTNHLIILCGKNITKLIEVKTKIKVERINITKLIKSKICLLRKELTHVGTHDKMRLMFDQTLEKLYFYYDSLHTRVKNENLLREQYDENKRREKKKENYKNNKMKIGALINAEKGKEKKPITALFNLKFIDFLKVFIGYDEEDKNKDKDNENNKKIIKIDEEKYGLKEIELEGFQTYEEYIQTIIDQKEIANKNKYREHIIKIINKEIKTKHNDLFKQLII